MPLQQKLGLSARLSQRLILTPSLQQAIKLLPLTTLELAEVLDQEVMENPLLEEVPVEETQAGGEPRAEEAPEREKAEPTIRSRTSTSSSFFEDYFDDGGERRTAARRPARSAAHREHAHRVAATSTITCSGSCT